jgi:hypothetical protein
VVEFMNQAHVNEAKVLSWLADAPQPMRDAALVALYLRQGKGPMGQLKLIMNSETLHDQVKAAERILLRWSKTDPEGAGKWLMTELPPGPERAELNAKLAPLVAAVNPQAAMEMANQDEMKDGEWKHATSQAVQQFALRNDVNACTQFIQQFADVDQYQEALGQVAAIKFEGNYAGAVTYLKANSKGDWRTAALRTLSALYFIQRDFDQTGAEFLKLNVDGIDKKLVTSSAISLATYWSWKQPMADPLNWTLKLPADMATTVRKRWSQSPDSGGHLLGQYLRWTEHAPISPAERAALQSTLHQRQQAETKSP